MFLESVIGYQPAGYSDGVAQLGSRKDRTNAAVVTDAHGRYHEMTARGRVFSVTNLITPGTLTVGLATTYVGTCVSNPASSPVALSILTQAFGSDGTVTGGPGVGGIGGGGASTGITAHTTPIAALWGSNLLSPTPMGPASAGIAPGSYAFADSAATLVGSPRAVMYTFNMLTLVGYSVAAFDVAGQVVVAPGGYVIALYPETTQTHMLCSFTWEETVL